MPGETPNPATFEKARSTEISTDPQFETGMSNASPDSAAPAPVTPDDPAARTNEARAAVAAANTEAASGARLGTTPPGRNREGYRIDDYNGGDRAAHHAQMAAARDRLDRMDGIPTAAEKAAMRAEIARKAARGPIKKT